MSVSVPVSLKIRAFAAAAIMPPLLTAMPFGRLCAWLDRRPSSAVFSPIDPVAVAAWVDRLLCALPGPWRHTCLKRSAILYYLFRRAGLPIELCIGVRRAPGEDLTAHAWLTKDGAPYLEREAALSASHTPIARFPERRESPGLGRLTDTVSVLLDTLQLGRELVPDLAQSTWHGVDTIGLPGLVLEEGCALWLYRRLRSVGAEDAPRPEFASWLSRRARDDAARNLLIDTRVSQLSEWLTEHQYPHVWLKGSARRLAAGHYPYADARATNDVDLLLPSDRAHAAWAELQRFGYEPVCAPELAPPDHFHLVPLWGADRVAVELHVSTSTRVLPQEAWRRMTSSPETVQRAGLSLAVPSATELLWQAVTHALLHGPAGFRLRYLQDASVILASASPIDWSVIVPRLESPEVPSRNISLAWLGAAAALTGRRLPPELSGVAPFELSRALRWRLTAHRRLSRHPRVVEKLVEEGTRAEIGWPVMRAVPGTAPAVRLRRRLSALAARGGYRAWRIF